jgi:nucleoside-diphosphate-sugar epimerase
MKRNILITGASGFVGKQIVRALKKDENCITAVVRRKGNENKAFWDEVADIVETQDIFSETPEWWKAVCKDIDTVIHAAWYAESGKYLKSPLNMNCLTGTLNMAEGAAQAGVRRFIGVGTCFEYDLSAGMLSVDTPLKPLTPYASAKSAAYMMLSGWLPLYSVEFAWCRLFYLYGEGEDSRRLVPYLRNRLSSGEPAELTGGRQIRDFMDVSEAGRQIAHVAISKITGPVNVCSGIPLTVRQLAEDIADEYGRRDLLHFGLRPDNLVDPPCVVGIKNYYQ